jgi:ATP/ADP translocase
VNITFKDKPKLSLGESMKVLLSSRYVRDLATLVVAYGISINLVEVTWKSKLKAQVCLSTKHPFVQVTCKNVHGIDAN